MNYDNMPDEVAAVMLELEDTVQDEDFFDVSEIMVDRMNRTSDPSQFLEPVFLFMEENPEAEMGHLMLFAEGFYKNGYEELLVESIKRRPTGYTLWMLNRMINDLSNPNRDSYVELMYEASKRSELNAEARADVSSYLTYIEVVNSTIEEMKSKDPD